MWNGMKRVLCIYFFTIGKSDVSVSFVRREAAAVNSNMAVRKLRQDLEEADANYDQIIRVSIYIYI